ncbi:MAG TPA: ribonuclease HI [Candidatus Paceibacterota bacterium]
MSKTIIFTDGSSRGNPGPGGWGAIISYAHGRDKEVREIGGANKSTTNNRMEMMAVVEALSFTKKLRQADSEITLYTDSEYVKKGATEWAYSWASNNWRTKANTPVLNKDLWQKIMELMNDMDIEMKVIAGHSGIPANERCDVIATTLADGNNEKLFDGKLIDYKVSLDASKQTFQTGPKGSFAKGKKAYSYVSAIKGIVKVHKTWAECEVRVKGEPNARFRKALTKTEESELIKKFSFR